ncbi:palmitoyltransferase ZDHHC22-like [Mercenaria mercenaria]|uniref:palmitoyltransferase ZDHHC22-like n=1 Tax=Mercenaria mercenaria TaxID=6596 RepID=UPI00234F747F|nr:palmitoyltransferase ZDHHC22-like [Mercenaria mercenaria]
MYYIIPYMFQDYNQWTRYFVTITLWFIVINMVTNWLCVILYNPAYPKTKDNISLQPDHKDGILPDKISAGIPQTMHLKEVNGQCVYDIETEETLPWHYCETCEIHAPFRSHHCKVCKTCILKMNHHCYIVGNCVGFNNQRYFAVFTFYIMTNCLPAAYFTFEYIQDNVLVELNSWTDLVLPLTIWRYVNGSINSLNCLLIFHLYTEITFGILGLFYFLIQMLLCTSGKTLYEKAKGSPVRNTNTFSRNMRSVFGEYWALNFLVPMTPIFRQRDDGIHWDGIKTDRRTKMNRKNLERK